MTETTATDWGLASPRFDAIKAFIDGRDLSNANEAQTRHDVIDRIIREVLGWQFGNIHVEEHAPGHKKHGYVDYILRVGDTAIVVEAKKIGASFPAPTDAAKLKLSGAVLGASEMAAAIIQAREYAERKDAQVAIVTNGLCWCFFTVADVTPDSYASLLFPFSKDGHAEKLFNHFSVEKVSGGSVGRITNELPGQENRLLIQFRMADDRVDRNTIADQIAPALNNALYAEALSSNAEALRRCFVTTEARTKFDSMLGMHLADPKPSSLKPAKRINRGKKNDHLESIIANSGPSFAPPVTLIIGPVGAGKSTYLKHFELVSGSELLASKSAKWIYVDMEAVGKGGDPRAYMYAQLKEYIGKKLPGGPEALTKLVEAAYADEIAELRAGPLSFISKDEKETNRLVAGKIFADYTATEPYLDRVLTYLAKKELVVIVLDNIDLYEDDKLETEVFAEGLALSKRIHCHVIVSVRDSTFIRHKNDSAFNAYELRKLWLDPPPLKSVISARLTYSKKILEGKSAIIDTQSGMHLQIPDLSVFFEIVQQSILRGRAGDYVEAIADLDVRRGISLVRNFLTSGHIEADRALRVYLTGDTQYYFPFHEVFKGSMLGQWANFREERTEGVNLFDSRMGSRRLRLLRVFILQFLLQRARVESAMEVTLRECCDVICEIGATPTQVVECLDFLVRQRLVRTTNSEAVSMDSTVVISRSGGYYVRILSRTLVYVEECMYDTAIDSDDAWERIRELTATILTEQNPLSRMQLRKIRMMRFLQALEDNEAEVLANAPAMGSLTIVSEIRSAVLAEIESAIEKVKEKTQIAARGRVRGTAP